MRRTALTALATLALAGCGDGEDDAAATVGTTAAPTATATTSASDTTTPAAAGKRTGTRITLRGSEFGRMIFGPGRQAIYVFERDERGRSNCYGECAELWPPVYTKGAPRAGEGVRQRLLGTTRRRDGRRQVTYAGRPLYYYAHEGPGEVRCHNVNLNGGLWWVVGPGGKPRP
jgi:predicted lipoprotein with Yx(FWY)xxD motif